MRQSVHTWTDPLQLQLLELQVQVHCSLLVSLLEGSQPPKLSARISIVGSVSKIEHNQLQRAPDTAIAAMLDYVMPVAEAHVNSRLARGMRLPWIQGIHMLYPSLVTLDGAVLIASDVKYVPQ